MDEMTPGQAAFEAYNNTRGGLTHDGKPTPPWAALGDGVRDAWEVGAQQAILVYRRELTRSPAVLIKWAIESMKGEAPSRTHLEDALLRLTYGPRL